MKKFIFITKEGETIAPNGSDVENMQVIGIVENVENEDEALKKLSAIDERKSQVVELRYFGGLSVKETAEVLKVSPVTVARDWDMARAWLAHEIGHGD